LKIKNLTFGSAVKNIAEPHYLKGKIMKKKKEKIVIDKTDALVVVDMQKDFLLKTGALYVKGVGEEPSVEELICKIKKLSKLPFSFVVVSKDMHPGNHIEFGTLDPYCVFGTEGVCLHRKIEGAFSRNATIYTNKGDYSDVVSLSIASSDQFSHQLGYLREKKVKRIFLTGVAYNFCVGESAIDYARQGFEVYVIRDATRSVPLPKGNLGSAENMDQKLKAYGVKLISFADIS
jgi:nicotinamidase-related amidase